MTKFENESLLQLLSIKSEELKTISDSEEDIYVNDDMLLHISKSALLDLSKRIIDLRSEIFFVNSKLE